MSGGMEPLHCIDWWQNWKKRKQNSLKWSDQWYELLLCLAQSLGMEIFQNPQISPKKGDHIFWVKFSFCRFSGVGWGEMRNASAIGSVSTLLVAHGALVSLNGTRLGHKRPILNLADVKQLQFQLLIVQSSLRGVCKAAMTGRQESDCSASFWLAR